MCFSLVGVFVAELNFWINFYFSCTVVVVKAQRTISEPHVYLMDKLQLIGVVCFVICFIIIIIISLKVYANANNLNGIDAHIYVVVQRTYTHNHTQTRSIDRRFQRILIGLAWFVTLR